MAYVYRHIRLDKNVPFYIGIGTDKYYKRAKTSAGRNDIWKKIAAKTEYEVEILFSDIDLSFAKEKEKEFIALYGRIDNNDGMLANLSGGGDGLFNVSAGVRKRLSEINKGSGNHFYGKKHTAETREMISKMQLGTKRGPLPQSTRNKIGAAHKGRVSHNRGKKDEKGGLKRSGVNHPTYKGVVYAFTLEGVLVKEFVCIKDAATFFEVNGNCIRRVIVGDRKKCKEHIFSYNKTLAS